MYYYRELIPQTSIDHVLVAKMIKIDTENIILVKGNILEVYDVILGFDGNKHLIIAQNSEFYSKILAVTALRKSGGIDILLLAFSFFKISCVYFDKETNSLKTSHIFDFEDNYIPKHSLPNILFESIVFQSNSHKNIAALLMRNQIIVFFAENSPEESRFKIESRIIDLSKTDVKQSRLIDIVFLNDYGSETLGLLYEPLTTDVNYLTSRSDTCSFSALVVDSEFNDVITVWSRKGLPYDSYRIVPICGSIGGVAIFGTHHLIYVSQSANFFLLTFSSYISTTMTNILPNRTVDFDFNFNESVFLGFEDSNIIVSSNTGDFYIFEFIVSNFRVLNILVKPINFKHATSTICIYENLIFLGSRLENSYLVEFKYYLDLNLWQTEILDKVLSFGGSIFSCFGLTNEKKGLEICCLNAGSVSGKVHLIRKSIKFNTINTLKIPTAGKIISISIDFNKSYFNYIVICLKNSTLVLLNDNDMVEIDDSNFVLAETTHAVFETHFNEIIQITDRRIRLFNIESVLDEKEISEILTVKYTIPYLFILTNTNKLVCFLIKDKKIYESFSLNDILSFSSVKLNSSLVDFECVLATVSLNGNFMLLRPSQMIVLFKANIFPLPNILKFSEFENHEKEINNIFKVKEIFFALLGEAVLKNFLLIRCLNFIVMYELIIESDIFIFKRCRKLINISENIQFDAFSYIPTLKKFPAVFVKSNPPIFIASTNTSGLESYTIESSLVFKYFIRFESRRIQDTFISIDEQFNINFLQLSKHEKLYKGWVHKIIPLEFNPLFVDFHPNFNTYFICGQSKNDFPFPDSSIYSLDSKYEVKLIKTMEKEETSHMKLLFLNFMDSRALFLVTSSNLVHEENTIGKLTIFDVTFESSYSVTPLHVLEFDAGILSFDCLDGKIVVASFDKIYMIEYDKDANTFLNIGSIQTGYSTTSIKCLKDFVVVGDMLMGINLLHFQKSHNYISLLGKKHVKQIPQAVDFIIHDTKTDFVAAYADGSLITYSYNPEISKTKNGIDLIMTSGMKLPARVNNILKILDKRVSKEIKITMLFLVQNSGALGFLIPINEKVFRRHILLKSRLNDYLPDEAALNFSRERGSFCDNHFLDSNTKQILDEIMLEKFLSFDLSTCYKMVESYGISFSQIIEDSYQLDQYIIKNLTYQ